MNAIDTSDLIRIWFWGPEGQENAVYASEEAALAHMRQELAEKGIDLQSNWRTLASSNDRWEATLLEKRIASGDLAARIALDALVERVVEDAGENLKGLARLAYGELAYVEVIDWELKIHWRDGLGDHSWDFYSENEALESLAEAAGEAQRSICDRWEAFATPEEREAMAKLDELASENEDEDDEAIEQARWKILEAIEERVCHNVDEMAEFAIDAHAVWIERRPEPTVRA
jgi:hypothetical protein